MIELEDGISLCGRCVCGYQVGYILSIGRETYTIGWLDGATTTQLRPDIEIDDEQSMAEVA